MLDLPDLSRARDRMVNIQIAGRGVRDPLVLEAMRRVPREAFVEPGFEEFAYEDGPLPIGEGQTISQPYIVALMIEAAEVKPGDHVLEVGTGSGYAAAVMSQIANRVYTIERHPSLAETARRRFGTLGYENIEVRTGDGSKGWPGAARGQTVPQMIAAAAEPLPDFDDPSFGRLFDRFANRRVVLLGEASHGTSEFYRARAAITRHLIEHHGFTIVAVEADWPDAAAVDRYVRHRPGAADAEPPFQRFPTWMWRNTDVASFIDWLRGNNEGKDSKTGAGFYGLDIYNMSGSIAAVLDY